MPTARKRDRKARRKEWFELGARALAAVAPNVPRGYACPLCRRLFTTLGGLSEEDVPPRSIGGRPLVLTCAGCNGRAGHQLDHHIRTAADIREIAAGERFMRGRFTQFGRTLNVDMTFGSEPEIRITEHNHPDAIKGSQDDLRQAAATGTVPPDMTLQFRFRHDPWKEQIAWLRVGYLYAFATLGYSFAFLPVVDPIRDQISKPDAKLLTGLVRRISPPGPKVLVVIRVPEDLRGAIVVCVGDWIVFLPGLDDDLGFYERAAALPPSGEFRIAGRLSFELPRRPAFCLDLRGKNEGPPP